MHPFAYDRFQQEAIRAIQENRSVFVSAPTGAGKTVIAEVAVEQALRAGGMAIYTAPIKALSNQKFRDFHARYGDRVGILTGDVTLNPDAPLLIMTTEIYRNSLMEGTRRFARCRWIIFDEVHFLDDPERGTVWEEALLLTPRQTEILALSATIPNAKDLAAWIEKIHGRQVQVVQETHRPVPLKLAFQCQNELYEDLEELKAKGYRGQERLGAPPHLQAHHQTHRHHPGRRHGFRRTFEPQARANRADDLLRQIHSAAHLPCLYFTFSRRRTEDLAWEFAGLNLISPENRSRLLEQFDRLCQRYQIGHERSAYAMRELVTQGVAYHHAGLLPTLKEVVEILFASRLLQTIVTTETFALGVNMPARSVVLDTLTRLSERPGQTNRLGRTILRGRELSQMIGRAGRRGMDKEGFAYLRVNPWEIGWGELTHLIQAAPEQVASRFNLTYATLLNLYRTYGQKLLPFYQQTFHAYQASQAHQREVFSLVERKLSLLKEWDYLEAAGRSGPEGWALTPKGAFASGLYGYELILSELFEGNWLDGLDTADLGIFLLAMVYEPRRRALKVKLPRRIRSLEHQIREVIDGVHRQERRFKILPLSKAPAFQLSAAMEIWVGGSRFDKVVQQSRVDEGELIRYFRMTVQMARSLAKSPSASGALKEKAQRLHTRINRDPVDAEAELRRSL